MADSKPIPVRLDPALIERLDAAAKRMGTNRAALMRFLVQTFADDFETRGFLASLPSNWREIMRGQDGRSGKSQYQFQEQSLRVAEAPPENPKP